MSEQEKCDKCDKLWFISFRGHRLCVQHLSEAINAEEKRKDAAIARVEILEAAIRKHRDQRGDARCWLDDADLYGAIGSLPLEVDTRLPCREEFLESCRRYYERRRALHDMEPPPGQMTIGQLEAEVERLNNLHDADGWCRMLKTKDERITDLVAELEAERAKRLEDCLAWDRKLAERERQVDQLKAIIEAERASVESLSKSVVEVRNTLWKATKAGTPYWHERDAMNALVLENQRLTEELEAERAKSAPIDPDAPRRFRYRVVGQTRYGVWWRSNCFDTSVGSFGSGSPEDCGWDGFEWLDPKPDPERLAQLKAKLDQAKAGATPQPKEEPAP